MGYAVLTTKCAFAPDFKFTRLPNNMLVPVLLATFASANIIGVAPEKQHLYKPDSLNQWACLSDPSIKISFDQINDDHCDCPDGSDEPATNACPYSPDSKFYCANDGFFPNYIENFKLNDGVCDYELCCDGSDEWLSGNCPNRCSEIKQKFDEHMTRKRADLKRALDTRAKYVEKAASLKQEVADSLAKLKSEITTLEESLTKKQSELEEAKQEAASELNESRDNINQLSSLLRSTLNKFTDEDTLFLQNLLDDLTPDTIKDSTQKFKEFLVEKQIISSDQESTWEIIRKALANAHSSSESSGGWVHNLFTRFIEGFKNDPSSEIPILNNQGEISTDKTARIGKAIEALEKEIHSKNAEASIFEDNLQKVFGRDDILRAVEGERVFRKIGEYNYQIGFLDSILQDNILIGRATSVGHSSIHFAHGTKCWNGPHRSAIVDLVCAPENKLISVNEPEKCQYRFLVESPIVCTEMSDEEIAKSFKIDPSEF